MIARSEPCDCYGIPHRRLIVEAIAHGETYTLMSICEWAYWLTQKCCGRYGWRFIETDPARMALAKAGLEPAEPAPGWIEALAEMDD